MPKNKSDIYRSTQSKKKSILKWIIYSIFILFACQIQVLPTLFGINPVLIISVTICIAMFEGPIPGAIVGLAGGLLWDVFDSPIFGFNGLWLMWLCMLAGLLSQLFIRNNFLSSLGVISVATALQFLFNWFFNYILASKPEPFFILNQYLLPQFFISIACFPVIYAAFYLFLKLINRTKSE